MFGTARASSTWVRPRFRRRSQDPFISNSNFHFTHQNLNEKDFLSAYSAVNQGHSHPKIVETLVDQAQHLALSSRAFHNDIFGRYAQFTTDFFGFEMLLPMNTGAEAVETAIKVARRWGYAKKGIEDGKAIVLSATENFHGRTLAIICEFSWSQSG